MAGRSSFRPRRIGPPGSEGRWSLIARPGVKPASETSRRGSANADPALVVSAPCPLRSPINRTSSTSVTERIREIGLRLAVGARRSDILGQFLVEATTLSLIGGIAGVALGLGGAVAVERYANLGVVLNGQLSLVAMAFAAGVGIFFGFYPAWKASLLQPVEALRSD